MSGREGVILSALRQPGDLPKLSMQQWDTLLRQARQAGVLPRLAFQLADAGLDHALPAQVRDHLTAARALAAQHERSVRWEVNRIERALTGVDAPVVLLKGAAYVMAGLPPARGRLVSDVDIMTPKERLTDVEQALAAHGWEPVKLDPYDQRYYRTWMHELPPMQHKDRRTVIDVHHTILPETSRLRPDPAKLFAAAQPVDGGRLHVLAPADMVLHSAAHLFQDGDLAGSVRDVTDLADLLAHFGQHVQGFWDRLVPRADALQLVRPLYYALRFTTRMLDAPVPDRVRAAAQIGRPAWPAPAVMDALATRALLCHDRQGSAWATDLARLLLYIRSHWLRMPPRLLVAHLSKKATRRWLPDATQETP